MRYEPPRQDLRCLQTQLFSSVVLKELNKITFSINSRIWCVKVHVKFFSKKSYCT